MAIIGKDGGLELARRLEVEGVWRAWLGDKDYASFAPHLSSLASWSALVRTDPATPPPRLRLQLRVRALLYDKACCNSLCLDEIRPPPPSSLDPSYLQLHGDDIYFSLEQDNVDLARLQSEKNVAVSPSQAKVLNLKNSFSASHLDKLDGVSSTVGSKFGETGGGARGFENGVESELWYSQWFEKNSGERIDRLLWYMSQRKLPFKDRDALQRTPQGMMAYMAYLSKYQKSRVVLKTEKSCSPVVHPITPSHNKPGTADYSETASTQRMVIRGQEDLVLLPETMFPWNIVPDNPVSSRKRLKSFDHRLPRSVGLNDNPVFCSDSETRLFGSKGTHDKGREVAKKKSLMEEEAICLLKRTLARMIAGMGFEGIKESALECLMQLSTTYINKIGRSMRVLVDNYRNQCSQSEHLRMLVQSCGCGDMGKLLEYMKDGTALPAPQQPLTRINLMQHSLIPLQVQFEPKQSPPLLSPQIKQNLSFQQQYDKVKRRQASSPRGMNIVNKKIVDAKMEMGTEYQNLAMPDPSSLVLKQSGQSFGQINQMHQSSWQQQQLAASQHPHLGQQLKQLSALQPQLMQHQNMISRDGLPMKMPHVKVEGLHELMGSEVATLKQETDEDRDGLIGSPSKRKRL